MNIIDKLGFTPARWEDDALVVLDQRVLPVRENYLRLKTMEQTGKAISNLTVRGAPLIGIVAAYGLCLVPDPSNEGAFDAACDTLIRSRPTAVNLSLAVDRMKSLRDKVRASINLRELLLAEARAIHREDAEMCRKIGKIGNELIPESCRILTHCNTGALATGGIGTALGVIYSAHFAGKRIEVWVDETRPVLQGSRLTAWELTKAKVPHRLIADNMAGRLMADGKIDLVITGADRIAANLDFANKTGTYSLAVLANYHNIPFYCAAPSTTFDHACPDGASIPIEHRADNEISMYGNNLTAPSSTKAYNPAFDFTPHNLIDGIITEKGMICPDR